MRVVSSDEYYNWLIKYTGRRAERYSQLLDHLFWTEFTYILEMDENRISDGIDLRYRFMSERGCIIEPGYMNAPCSVLEIMVALAIRCEVHIMNDSDHGDRTSSWFWNMIASLGLGGMTDGRYDGAYVDDVISGLLDRNYEPDGRGSLFALQRPRQDMRSVEIWYQMMSYLNEYLGNY